MKCNPTQGGCWFCCTDDDGQWGFSIEFDTNFHLVCLKKALEPRDDDSVDPEAQIIGREFGLI